MQAVHLRRAIAIGLAGFMLAATGCIGGYGPNGYVPPEAKFAPPPVLYSNPLLTPLGDREVLWQNLVDVVDDYFQIEREQRVQLVGDVLTEGSITTYPLTSATLLEPFREDSVTPYERLEATLQSTRRIATVRVTPAETGFLIDVQVLKELEDVLRPESKSAGDAPLRNDDSNSRLESQPGNIRPTIGWIGLGRDTALEQQILFHLQTRLGVAPRPPGAF